MAAQRADPALLRHDHGDRLAHHHRLFDRRLVVLRRLGEVGAAPAERGLRTELVLHLLDLAGDGLPLLVGPSRAALRSLVRSSRSALSSPRISISSSLRKLRSRMLRMASACTSVSLKAFISTGLGSSSRADDLDDLVEVEIGDEIAAEHFQAMLDLAPAGAWSGAPARRGGGRAIRARLRRGPAPAGCGPSTSTFMLSGMRLSSSVSLNSNSISSSASTVRALRLDARGASPRPIRRARRRPAAASSR